LHQLIHQKRGSLALGSNTIKFSVVITEAKENKGGIHDTEILIEQYKRFPEANSEAAMEKTGFNPKHFIMSGQATPVSKSCSFSQ
jgi:hypothetical protein